MNVLSRDELKILAGKQSERCDYVSIFMTTYKGSLEVKQNPARLKNLIAKAEEKLGKVFPRTVEARKLLSPIEHLLSDGLIWQHPSNGMAIFLSRDMFRYYPLPLNFEECVVVCNRFHIRPLLPLFISDGRYYILALSQNKVRLLQCTHFKAKTIDLAGITPGSLADTIGPEHTGRNLQYHTGAPGKGKESEVFHGHGPEKMAENDITRYFREINKRLCHKVLKEENAPMVLAGVEYLHPIYKKINTYRQLLDVGIPGNPEGLSSDELHQRAWSLVQPYFDRTKSQAISEYQQLVGTGHTSNNIEEIIPNAYAGGVERLFIVLDTHKWGTFDPDSRTVKQHEKAESCDADLMDLAVAYTITNSGEVFVVKPGELPDDLPLAAVFRHEIHHPAIGHKPVTSRKGKRS